MQCQVGRASSEISHTLPLPNLAEIIILILREERPIVLSFFYSQPLAPDFFITVYIYCEEGATKAPVLLSHPSSIICPELDPVIPKSG